MEELKVGDIIKERYALVQFLGSGSFGEVWLAHDRMTGRDVALKIYLSLDPAGVEEFQREYSNTFDLSSSYLLTPDHFDVYGRRPFLVMKYCENGSSSKLVGNIKEDQIWNFISDVANGLAVLHRQSDPIVHQDIKPDNILIDGNGRYLITDFGISKRLRATMRRHSKRDVSSGAMPYMAPERFESNPKLTTASDIWSLGASIYELATGELPFSGFGGAMQRNGAELPSLPFNYSPALNDVMQRCLSIEEKSRPSAFQLLSMLNQRQPLVSKNNSITDFPINDPEVKIQLNIGGFITPTIITPYFNDTFGCVWFFCFIFLLSSMFGFLHDLHAFLYMNGLELSPTKILRGISLLGPPLMWIVGYVLVKRWYAQGKYIMCGAIYLMFILWAWGIIGSLSATLPDFSLPNKEHWYNYIGPVIGFTLLGLFLIASLFGLLSSVRAIKRGDKINPSIWVYHGTRFLPIVYEYILPIIVLSLYILSWII